LSVYTFIGWVGLGKENLTYVHLWEEGGESYVHVATGLWLTEEISVVL